VRTKTKSFHLSHESVFLERLKQNLCYLSVLGPMYYIHVELIIIIKTLTVRLLQ